MNLQQIRNRSRSNSRQRSRSRQKSVSSHSRQINYKEDQEQFEANQQIIRSLLRIEQNREQPIDRFVKVVWIYKEKLTFDHKSEEIMKEPKIFLNKLSIHQLQELQSFTKTFQKTQKKLNSNYINYWIALRAIINAIILQKNGENAINQNFKAKVDQIVAKPYDQLLKMQKVIQNTLSIRSGSDNAFWNTINMKIELRKRQMQLSQFYIQYKQLHKQQQGSQQEQDSIQLEQPISPILGPVSVVNQRLITLQENQIAQRNAMAEKIFKQQFEKCRQNLQENLSLPKNHNLLNTAIINQSTVAYDYITKQIIEFQKYKRMEEDEEEFDDWVPCQTQGRFRDRKPQYINRRRVTIEWNKYNTMHYNQDNPPPKTIQGYKFNIFYPDLYDKQKTPQYYLQTTQSPDYCLIKFKAGPPYKDIAFKILRKQWDFTQKSGCQSIFHRGILQLYFNFKKPKFRI